MSLEANRRANEALIEGAKLFASGRRRGLTDDETLQEAYDEAMKAARKGIRKRGRANAANAEDQLRARMAENLQKAGYSPDEISAFFEIRDAEMRSLGIENARDPRLGPFQDNRQGFQGEKGGLERSPEFLRRVAQAGNEGEDPNLFQNFGGQVGLGGGNRNQNNIYTFYDELVNAQNERGLTPFDVSRERRQGEVMLPPDVVGEGLGVGKRPGSLQEYLEFKRNINNVDSPDGVFGSPLHLGAVKEAQDRLAYVIESQYQLEFGSKAARDLRKAQFEQDNLDRLGEDWKQQDFGGGRQLPDGVARRQINQRGEALENAGFMRDQDGNFITAVGRDGKERRVRLGNRPGQVWGGPALERNSEGDWVAPKMDIDGRAIEISDVDPSGLLRPQPEDRFFGRAPQMVGNAGGATRDAVRRIEDAVNAGTLSLTDEVPNGRGRKRTVQNLLDDLNGVTDGRIGIKADKAEAEKAVQVALRRADGVFTPVELERARRKAATAAIVGNDYQIRDGDGVMNAFGFGARPGVGEETISFLPRDPQQNTIFDVEPRLVQLQDQLNQIDGSTREGAVAREGVLGEMRRIMIQGGLGREGRNGPNPEFSTRRFNANRAQPQPALVTQAYSGIGPAIEAGVGEAIDAEAQRRAEVGPARRRQIRAQNEFIAQQLPEMMANEAVRVAGERRGRPLNPIEEQAFRRNLQQEILPGERITGINGLPGQGYNRFERKLVRGNYDLSLPEFSANIQAAPEISRRPAEPFLGDDGNLAGWMDPESGTLLGETDPQKMMQWDEANQRWSDPARTRTGPLSTTRNWIDGNLFDEFDERRMGDSIDENWPKEMQIVQPLDDLGAALGKRLKRPVVIRGVDSFDLELKEFIAKKQGSSRPFFDLPDPNNPGQNMRVPISQIPEDQLFDAALKDLKVQQKPIARALNVLDEGRGNINPASMEVINATDKVMFEEGSPDQRVGLMRQNRRLANRMQEALDVAERDWANVNGPGVPMPQEEKLRVIDEVRGQVGIKKLSRDANIQVVGGARLKQPQRNEQGIMVADEGRLIAPMLRQLNPDDNINLILDQEVQRIESEMGVRVSPRQRQAIRDRIELDNNFSDIDVWGPEAKKPFIGAIGEGNRGGGLRKGPNDRQNVAAVNPDLPTTEIRRNAVFPVPQAKIDKAARQGRRIIPDAIDRGAIQQQLQLRDRLLAERENVVPTVENRRGALGPFDGQARDVALDPGAISLADLGLVDSASAERQRRIDSAQAPIIAEARRRQPLKPEDLILLDRREAARQRGEVGPIPAFRVQNPDQRGVFKDRMLGDGSQMQRGVFENRGVEVGPPKGRQRRNFPAATTPPATSQIPTFGADQASTSLVATGSPNMSAPVELSAPGYRNIPSAKAAGVTDSDIWNSGSAFEAKRRRMQEILGTGPVAPSGSDGWGEGTIPRMPQTSRPADQPISLPAAQEPKAQPQEQPRIDTNAGKYEPEAKRTFRDRAGDVGNQIRDFARNPQYQGRRRIGYGLAAAGTVGAGLGALISGERQRREEEQQALR